MAVRKAARVVPGPGPADYGRDVAAWSVEQARLLRAGLLDQIDIEHVADEIEDVGKSEARELASRMAVLLAHWLKWEHQPLLRSPSWQNTIREQRKQVLRRLKRTPSLGPELENPDFIEEVWSDARLAAAREASMDIARFPPECPCLFSEVLREDWIPSNAPGQTRPGRSGARGLPP